MPKFKSFLESHKVLFPFLAAVALVVVGLFTVARADNDNITVNDGGTVNIDNNGEAMGAMFGATGDSNFTNVVASGDITAGDDLTVADDAAITGDLTVTGNITAGAGVNSISTSSATYTLTQSDVCSYNYIEFTPLGAAATVTLPATSTVTSCLDTAGGYKEIIFENAASAATTTTIAAGAGMDLQEPDGQNVVIGQNNFAIIKFWKRSDTDMVVIVDETIPAD